MPFLSLRVLGYRWEGATTQGSPCRQSTCRPEAAPSGRAGFRSPGQTSGATEVGLFFLATVGSVLRGASA